MHIFDMGYINNPSTTLFFQWRKELFLNYRVQLGELKFYEFITLPHQIPLQTSRRVPHQALLHRQAAALPKPRARRQLPGHAGRRRPPASAPTLRKLATSSCCWPLLNSLKRVLSFFTK